MVNPAKCARNSGHNFARLRVSIAERSAHQAVLINDISLYVGILSYELIRPCGKIRGIIKGMRGAVWEWIMSISVLSFPCIPL